jgi:hypothetical protein
MPLEDFAQRQETSLRQITINRLNQLPPHKLAQALDFIEFLLERSHIAPSSSRPQTPGGSLQDLLACVGIWEFEPGELDTILEDIEQSRLMELEQDHDSLSA